jgi:hypothetical protein
VYLSFHNYSCRATTTNNRKLKVRRDPSNVAAGIVEVKHNTPVPSWRNLIRGGAVMMDAHSLEAGTVHLALTAKAPGNPHKKKKSGKASGGTQPKEGDAMRTYVEVSHDELYAVAATMMDLSKGGCRCVGVTLLPPGGWFLHMAFLTFGLFAPKELQKGSRVTREQRTEAKAFDESCALLGEALIYQPHLTSWLLDLFHLPSSEATMRSFGYGSPRNEIYEITRPEVDLTGEPPPTSPSTAANYDEAELEEIVYGRDDDAVSLPGESVGADDDVLDDNSDYSNFEVDNDHEISKPEEEQEQENVNGDDDVDDDDSDDSDEDQLFSQYSEMSRRNRDREDDLLLSQYSGLNRRRQVPVAKVDSDWETDDDDEDDEDDDEDGDEDDDEEDEDEDDEEEDDEDDDNGGVESPAGSEEATETDCGLGSENEENGDDLSDEVQDGYDGNHDDQDSEHDGTSSYEDGEFDEDSGDDESESQSRSVDAANIPSTLKHAESLLPAILANLGDPGDVVWPYQIFHALSQRISKKELKVALDTFKRPPNTPHCPSREGLAWLLSLKWIKLESYIIRDTGAVQWVAFVPRRDAKSVPNP